MLLSVVMSTMSYPEEELEQFLGDRIENYKFTAIIEEATEQDCETGNRRWKEGVILSEVCKRHSLLKNS